MPEEPDSLELTDAHGEEEPLLDDLRVVLGRRQAASPALRDLDIGERLGSYEIHELLGEGGMARVYRAVDAVAPRTVALKVLKPEYQASRDIGMRFEREAQSMASIRHENVVRVYGTPSDEHTRAIAMELLPGGSLRDWLLRGARQRRRLSVSAVTRFALQAAKGLGAAHAVGIVHRDIKPGNLMLSSAGRIKVVDFGVGLALERATWLTGLGKPIGTPAYMSPEQCQGERVGPASDVYSLGVTMFELVTARLPFTGEAESPFALMLKHIHEPPPDPRRWREKIPPWLAQVILRCLQKDPAARYGDGVELADALAAESAATGATAAEDLPFKPSPQINVSAVRDQLARLPQRAIVAWACRCARRVGHLNADPRVGRSLALAEEFVYGDARVEETDTLGQALARVKRFRNASFKAAYVDGDVGGSGAAAQAALAAAAASACAAARCVADAAADGAFVARCAAAALTLANTPLTEFWSATQRDYHRLLTSRLGAEGTVGAHLPSDFWQRPANA